jgi:RIO kinase 1
MAGKIALDRFSRMHEKQSERRDRERSERKLESASASANKAEGAAGQGGQGESPLAPQEAAPPVPPEFAATVQVTEAERAWIRQYLAKFLENDLILDVVRRVKAGKEATVYLCSAHPSTGRTWIAAKLYRERSMRSSKNVGLYQQGRGLLDEDGNSGKGRPRRQDRAVSNKSTRGKAAVQMSWLMHEFTLLETLHARGGDVPQPIAHGEQGLLMEFIGDGADASPTLNDVVLEPSEAQPLFDRVIFNIELLLELGWVHGDLSAYNILYQRGRIVLIDFPQVVDCQNNPRARAIFERDVERVAQYFEGAGLSIDHRQLASDLWAKHVPATDADLDPDPLS